MRVPLAIPANPGACDARGARPARSTAANLEAERDRACGAPAAGVRVPELPKRRLGRTGLLVTALGLGAMDTEQSPEGAETLHTALDLGINFIDTAREYAGSEFLLGQVRHARGAQDFLVATKTFERTADGAQRDVDRSLSMLGVEAVDLYQLHDIRTLEVWEQVMAPDGALEGLHAAASEGGGTSADVFSGFPMQIAGKTGTAEVLGKEDQSWYVALAPYPNPRYVVAVTVEEGGFGAERAAPIARLILAKLYNLQLDQKVVSGRSQTN